MKGLEEETFRQELEDRLREYFDLQRRFSTIGKRAVVWSLIDFPVAMLNFPFITGGLLFKLLAVFSPSSSRWNRYASWFRERKSRSGRFYSLLPPYRTRSAQSKINAFKRVVIAPLEKKYPNHIGTLNTKGLEETLLETLTRWEKIPSLMENILAPFLWLAGISFLGLDPKTALILSRDKSIYHRYVLQGRSWFGKTFLRIKWLFDDAIPWAYSVKFVVVGLVAYILLMILIEFLSVQVTYRKGVEKRLLKKIFQSEKGNRALEAPEKGA